MGRPPNSDNSDDGNDSNSDGTYSPRRTPEHDPFSSRARKSVKTTGKMSIKTPTKPTTVNSTAPSSTRSKRSTPLWKRVIDGMILAYESGPGRPACPQSAGKKAFPWVYLPITLATSGWYFTGWPEICLPKLLHATADPRVDGPFSLQDESSLCNWSPEQRLAMDRSITEGRLKLLLRPRGRNVLFEIIKQDGSLADSCIGLPPEWLERYLLDSDDLPPANPINLSSSQAADILEILSSPPASSPTKMRFPAAAPVRVARVYSSRHRRLSISEGGISFKGLRAKTSLPRPNPPTVPRSLNASRIFFSPSPELVSQDLARPNALRESLTTDPLTNNANMVTNPIQIIDVDNDIVINPVEVIDVDNDIVTNPVQVIDLDDDDDEIELPGLHFRKDVVMEPASDLPRNDDTISTPFAPSAQAPSEDSSANNMEDITPSLPTLPNTSNPSMPELSAVISPPTMPPTTVVPLRALPSQDDVTPVTTTAHKTPACHGRKLPKTPTHLPLRSPSRMPWNTKLGIWTLILTNPADSSALKEPLPWQDASLINWNDEIGRWEARPADCSYSASDIVDRRRISWNREHSGWELEIMPDGVGADCSPSRLEHSGDPAPGMPCHIPAFPGTAIYNFSMHEWRYYVDPIKLMLANIHLPLEPATIVWEKEAAAGGRWVLHPEPRPEGPKGQIFWSIEDEVWSFDFSINF